jgi:integrase
MLMQHVDAYLAVRRTGGFGLSQTETYLRQFAAFAAVRGEDHVRAGSAVAWAAQASTADARRRRLQPLVIFARYLRAEDPDHEVPPDGYFARGGHRPLPHIYSTDEAQRLVAAAARCGPAGSIVSHAMSALLSLIFATGLRISEALALRFGDVSGDGIVIRQTKFKKTRLVPLHPTAAAGLARYLTRRRAVASTSDRLFVNSFGAPLSYKAVQSRWHGILADAGIPRGPGIRGGPRIHDIRHTFAVRALESAPDHRDCIAWHMLAVSTYLGHAHVADTYWYLQATPGLMSGIADVCQHRFEGGRQ